MSGIQELVDWYKQEAHRLKNQIEALASGKEWRQTLDTTGQWVDTTDSQLDDCKRRLAQLELLIKRHEPKPDEGIRPEDLNSENDG